MTKSSSDNAIHVVLGAGPVGRAVADTLSRQGAQVRIVSKSGKASGLPPKVEVKAIDLSQPEGAAAAIAGASVIYHCAAPAYHLWVRDFPKLQDSIVGAVSKTNARLVVLDNLYAYGVNGVLTEDMPAQATGPKGQLRAQMAAALLAKSQSGTLNVAIARASDLIGPEVRVSSMGERFWPALLQGKTIQWFGDPDAPHSFTHVDDLARAMIQMGSEPDAMGRVWHVPSLPAVSMREVTQRAARMANLKESKITCTPEWMMRVIGLFVPGAKEVIEVGYQFTDRFEISTQDYEARFGGHATDLDIALHDTIRWWQAELGLAPDLEIAT